MEAPTEVQVLHFANRLESAWVHEHRGIKHSSKSCCVGRTFGGNGLRARLANCDLCIPSAVSNLQWMMWVEPHRLPRIAPHGLDVSRQRRLLRLRQLLRASQ